MTGIAVASPRASGSARIAASAARTCPAAASWVTTWRTAWPSPGCCTSCATETLLGRELVRDPREHARPVLDLEPEVERRGELAGRQPLEIPPDRIVLEEAGAGRPDDGDHVGDDRRRGLDAAGARPFERDLADRVALQHDRVEGALDRGQRMVAVDERRADAHVDAVADEARAADQLHVHVERARGGDVIERDALDPLDVDPVERHARAERDGREDRRLRRGVEPGDVLGRIGLGEAEPLRLGEGVAVGAPLLHRREDEVRRPVDDPEHAVHVRDDERLAQHLDHGDRRAHGRLEAELHAARRQRPRTARRHAGRRAACSPSRRAARSGAARARSSPAGSTPPITSATTWTDGSARIAPKSSVSTPGSGANARSLPVSRTSACVTRSRWPGGTLDLVRRLLEQPVHGGADGAVPEQRYGNVDGGHVKPTVPGPVHQPAELLADGLELGLRRLGPHRLQAGLVVVHVRDPLAGELAGLDVVEDPLHLLAHVLVDHALAARVVAELGRVRDRVAHAGEAVLVHQVDDQLQLVQALVVGDLRLVTGLDQGLEPGPDELGGAAAEDGLLAEEIGFGLLLERRLEDAGAAGADADRVGERELAALPDASCSTAISAGVP